MVMRLGRNRRQNESPSGNVGSSLFNKSSVIPRALRQLGQGLRRLLKRTADPVYEPDTQRLSEIVTGIRGASPVWCGGCGEVMTPIVLADGDQTRLIAISCLSPCCVSLPVRAGLLMGGEPASAAIH
jgi:hypothetical protein